MATQTPQLFLTNSYWTEFRAEILQVFQKENYFAYLLDQTFFHPQTNQQPYDKGLINGFEVTEVVKIEGAVLHVTKERVENDAIVFCEIDWDFRYFLMKQHSASHLLSCLVPNKFKKTVLHKVFPEWFSLFLAEKISQKEIDLMLEKANGFVSKNLKIETYFGTKCTVEGKIKGMDPSCETGPNRIVEIENLGKEVCYGTHVNETSEIGTILFDSCLTLPDGTFKINFSLEKQGETC
ncbi:alanyl-tRNA editing protein [bacterium]|nr:alanyl-tRNA editing protein [bacterium]